MKCTKCINTKRFKCKDSRPDPSPNAARRRRYECLDCGERQTVYEITREDYYTLQAILRKPLILSYVDNIKRQIAEIESHCQALRSSVLEVRGSADSINVLLGEAEVQRIYKIRKF